MTLDRSTLEAALIGYEQERERVSGKIEEIRRALGQRAASADGATPSPRKRRTMSAAAKKRIAAAQKARWAAWRKKQAK